MKKIASIKISRPTIKASKITMAFEESHALKSKDGSKRSKSHNSARQVKNIYIEELKIKNIPYISTSGFKPAWRALLQFDDDEPLSQLSSRDKKFSSKIVKNTTEKIAHFQENKRLILSMKFAMNYLQLNSVLE
ncbi:unnamed protein product [Blepharisma stoltei]|uniref:Uncharacterized protein n=1 Tax=Blepharisma stoltei TaxID=1481888 RepID=A0AAU9IM05_9CILI|nr:unnamed protein product [Blepharisma stoltei]